MRLRKKQNKTPENTRHPGEVFLSCAELPLKAFIRALVHKDLSALIKSGTVDMATLREAWDRIQIEYIEASSCVEEKMQLLDEVQNACEEVRINRCRMLVDFLWKNASEEVADCLREEDFHVPEAEAPEEERHEALRLILTLLSGDELRVDLSKKEDSVSKKGKAITEKWFYTVLIEAGKVVHHSISADGLSTLEFGLYFLQLKEAVAVQNAYSPRPKTPMQ